VALQILFPLLLYALGLVPGFFLHRRVPLAFFAWTAFAWGALWWTLASVALVWLPVSPGPWRVAFLLVLSLIVAATIYRARLARPASNDMREVALAVAAFLIVVSAVIHLSLVETGTDTFLQLLLAKRWAAGRLEGGFLEAFGLWGVVLPALHASAPAFGADYFAALSAAYGFTLLASFRYLCRLGLQSLPDPPRRYRLLATLSTLYLASSFFIIFQFFHIHNNLIAATYLLLAVGTLWLAHVDSSPTYLGLSMLAFLAFGMTRTETALYAVAFLIPALSLRKFAQRTWMRVLLPFTTYLTVWNLLLLLLVRPDTHIRNPFRLLIVVAAVVGIYVLALLAATGPLRNRVTPFLHHIMTALLTLVLVVLMVVSPGQLPRTLYTIFRNLLFDGWQWWGTAWLVAIALGLFALPRTPEIPYQRLFTTGIIGFVLILVIVGHAHRFRANIADSGNRTFVHLLPAVYLFLTLKVAPYLLPEWTRITDV
jgi:hypothetical protein